MKNQAVNEKSVIVTALNEILIRKGFNNIALKQVLGANPHLTVTQRGFVTETVNGVLRNLRYIDYCLDRVSKTPVNKMKPLIANTLRSSVYQLFYLSGIPEYAVCNEAVNLVKQRGFQNLSGFVNGVLRSVIREKDAITLPEDKVERLAVKYSYQNWMIEEFLRQFGDETEPMLIQNNLAPRVSICVNLLRSTKEDLIVELRAEGISVTESNNIDFALSLSGTSDITKLDAFKTGRFHVMDEASMLACLALSPEPGARVLDLCSAPGGKSFIAAILMGNKGEISSFDIHNHKLELIESGAKRLGINIIKTAENDATVFNENLLERFDYVIVDAPCSGLGLLRKKPDIKLTKTQADIQKLSGLQHDILSNAVRYCKKGGTLVYSTCTLTDKENQQNADEILLSGYKKIDLAGFAGRFSLNEKSLLNGYLQLLPHYNATDGFFIAKFKRV